MLSKQFIFSVLALGFICSSTQAWAAPRTFVINDEKNRDVVSFTSDAPLELIQGHTSKINGSITIDDSTNLTENVKCSFNVDLASIDTGIPLRNEHMRENFLHTAKFPKATFVLKKLIDPPKEMPPGQGIELKAEGDFTINGKTVAKTVPIEVTYFTKCAATATKRPDCDLIQFKTTFPVAFKDHDIPRPEVVFQKLADTVIVTVSATAYNQSAGSSGKSSSAATGNKAK